MSFLVLLLCLTGALASSPALFGRDDDPKAAIEAAVRGVTDSPTSRCLEICQFVGAEKTIKSCEDNNPLFDILVTDCLCRSIVNKLHDCSTCMQANASVVAAYQSFASICFNYGFISENGTALADEPDFPHPKIVLLSPLTLTQCEHAVYIWATPYFFTDFNLIFTPFNPANKSLPVETTVADEAGFELTVTNYTFLVDYPVNTQITLNATGAHTSAISTTLTVLNSSDTSCIPLEHTLTGTNATTGGTPALRGQWTLMTAILTLGIGVTLS